MSIPDSKDFSRFLRARAPFDMLEPQAFEAAIADLSVFVARWPDAVQALFTNRLAIDDAPAKLLDGRNSIKDVIRYA